MIDLNSSIVSNRGSSIDAINIAELAVSTGVSYLIATPQGDNTRDNIMDQVDEINRYCKLHAISIEVFPGQRIELSKGIVEDYKAHKIMTLNDSRYLLVSLPTDHIPHDTSDIFYDMQLAGIVPVIVNPECNEEFMKHPEKLLRYVTKGALTQISASSVMGKNGGEIKKFVHELITANLVHIIASDSQGMSRKTATLGDAYHKIEEMYGQSEVDYFRENIDHVLVNKRVHKREPQLAKKKKGWFR